MTIFEEYKVSTNKLVSRLNKVKVTDCNSDILNLITEASEKIKEMIEIIDNLGIANVTMASAIQIMTKR